MEYIRERALRGDFLAGAWCNMGSPLTAEMAGLLGYDWILIDQEHGPGDQWHLLQQAQATTPYKAACIARVAWSDRILIKKALDLGIGGIMIPNVQSAVEAAQAVTFAKYPPMGERGSASSPRCAGYGLHFKEYYPNANKNLITVAQIETGTGVDNAEAIAAVEGVDVLFVGPVDLSMNMNLPGVFDDPKFVDLLRRVSGAAKKHGKACGILLPNTALIPKLKELGYTFIACGSDGGAVMNAFKSTLDALRA